MASFNAIVMEFNRMLSERKFMEVLDHFYAPDAVVADNLDSAVAGIDALRAKAKDFVENVTIEVVELVSLMIEQDLSVTNWYYSYEHTTTGKVSGHRLSVQRWENNKIVQENHLYKP